MNLFRARTLKRLRVKQDWVNEDDVLHCTKEGLDDKQNETEDLPKTKVAHLQATAIKWVLGDSNVKLQGAHKGHGFQ